MSNYDFDQITDRRNTGSLKWDVAEGELLVASLRSNPPRPNGQKAPELPLRGFCCATYEHIFSFCLLAL